MIALYIIGGIAAFFALLLFSRVHLRLVFAGKPKLLLRFWFVVLDLNKILKRPKKEKKPPKKKTAAQQSAPEEKKKRSFSDLIELFRFVTGLLKRLLNEFFSRLRIRVKALRICIGASEPHVTAVLYGAASAAVCQLCEVSSRFLDCRLDYRKVGVVPDFSGASFEAECDADFSMRVFDVLVIGLNAFKAFLKLKSKKGVIKDERNTVEAGD